MTDKEKLNAIRVEVQNYIDAAHKAHTNITEGNFAHLLSFIDSLQEEPKPKFKVGDRIKFKGVRNEDVTRVITNIQNGAEGGFLYLFADGYIYSINDNRIELVEEPASEDLGEYVNDLSKQFPEVSFAKLSRIAVRVAKWQKEQMMKNAVECEYFDGSLFCNDLREKYRDCDKVKILIVKSE